MIIGLGIGIPFRKTQIAAVFSGFSPSSLFAAGEQGAWYEPSDFSTLFQDSAGTTPVTAVEQPVGLMLDKSKGLVLGPELVTNGDFSNGTTGWLASGAALSVENDRLKVVASGSGQGAYQNITNLVVGKRYKLTASGYYSGSATLRIGLGTAFAQGTYYDSAVNETTNKTYTLHFVAPATTVVFWTFSGAGTCYWDNISVRELPGNHAFQSTATSRPVLSARVNLLRATDGISGSGWTKEGLTAAALTDSPPPGFSLYTRVVENTTNGFHRLYQSFTDPGATVAKRVVAVVKAGGCKFAALNMSTPNGYLCIFDLESGTAGPVQLLGTATGGTADITPLGNGWYLIGITGQPTGSGFTGVRMVAPDGVSTTYVGDGVRDLLVAGMDLRVANDGVGLPAYQRVNTSTDYDTTGFPTYLKFDGVDDFLVTNSINFTSTDKMTVFAGVRKLSDAATALLAELSVSTDTNAGAFYVGAPSSGGITKFSFNSRGSVFPATPVGTASATYSAPVSAVVAAIGSISEDTRTLRLNSTVVATGGGVDQGTGNFGNYPLYIGRRGGTTLPFNGRLYPLIIRGAQSTAEQIAQTETYVNNLTKAYAP